MAQFRKKPVVIEATQWFKSGDHPEDNREMFHTEESGDFLGEGKVVRYYRHPGIDGKTVCGNCRSPKPAPGNRSTFTMHEHGWIDTLEGGHTVCPGDWIITGVQGERYPCKPDIFEATYDLVGSADVALEDPAFRAEVDKAIAEDQAELRLEDKRWVTCLALELPEEVYKDVRPRIDALYTRLENTVPHWVAMVLYSALDDIDTADDLAKGDDGLYRNLVRRYHQERHKVAQTDGYTVKFHAMDEQPEEVIGDFVPAPQYVKRLHNLVASMVEYLQPTEGGLDTTAFIEAWLSTFDDPDSFPEVTKIVNADKS